jgi:Tfp pilus assembly protein PilF
MVTGNYEQAETIASELVKIDPKSPEIWAFWAKAQQKNGQNNQAYHSASQALRLDPELSSAIQILEQIEMAEQQ